jgi:hypothetical protein
MRGTISKMYSSPGTHLANGSQNTTEKVGNQTTLVWSPLSGEVLQAAKIITENTRAAKPHTNGNGNGKAGKK